MAMVSSSPRRAPVLALGCLVAALVVPASAQGEALGRLFFTPEQRTALDKQRFAPEPEKKPEPEVTAKEQEEVTPPPAVHSFRMEGLVVRRQGPNTAWVDGSQVLRRGRTFQGVTVDPSTARGAGVTVEVPGAGGAVALKPGQTFNPESAEVSELIPRRGAGASAARPAGGEPADAESDAHASPAGAGP